MSACVFQQALLVALRLSPAARSPTTKMYIHMYTMYIMVTAWEVSRRAAKNGMSANPPALTPAAHRRRRRRRAAGVREGGVGRRRGVV